MPADRVWSELAEGDEFAGYRIERRLGRGGMGILYLALEPGLEYKNERLAEGPFSIHVLRIDRGRADWRWIAPAGEVRIMGLSPLTKIVEATERWQKTRAVAAINGDWFEIKAGPYQGDPRGTLIAAATVGIAFFISMVSMLNWSERRQRRLKSAGQTSATSMTADGFKHRS